MPIRAVMPRQGRNTATAPWSRRLAPVLGPLMLCLSLAAAAASGAPDRLLERVAATYGASARAHLLDWRRLVASSRGDPEPEKIEAVNRFFNRVRFISDARHWGRRDYWATPVEMLSTGGGDCEDFSIAKYFTLEAMGVPVERLRVTYVDSLDLGQAHMVLAYYPEPGADPLILDNLTDAIRPESRRPDLVPVYSFNRNGLWKTTAAGADRRIGSPRGLSRWRELTGRIAAQREWIMGATADPFAPESDLGMQQDENDSTAS